MHQRHAQRIEYDSRLRRFFYFVHRVQVMRRRIRAGRYFGREVTGLRHRPQVGISQDNLDLAELAVILLGLGLVSQRIVLRAQFQRFSDCAIDVVTFTQKSSTCAVDEETEIYGSCERIFVGGLLCETAFKFRKFRVMIRIER
jgi:hypothetical protein